MPKVLAKMIERKDNLLMQDGLGKTALHLAQDKGYAEMAQALFDHHPTLCTKGDNDGITPLHIAAQQGDLVLLRRYLTTVIDLNEIKDADGNTPLHAAARANQLGAAQLLLEHGAKAALINNHGSLPRDLCPIRGDTQALEDLLRSKEKSSLFDQCAIVVDALKEKTELPTIVLEQLATVMTFQQSLQAQKTIAAKEHIEGQKQLEYALAKLSINQ
jgi:ankyrin repeat protein